jgi:hypothetical protein
MVEVGPQPPETDEFSSITTDKMTEVLPLSFWLFIVFC